MSVAAPSLPDDDRLTPARLRALVAVISMTASVGTGLSLGLPLLSLVAEARGVSSTMIGLNNAVAGLVILLIGPWVTPLARRFGAVPLLIVAVIVASLSLPLFYLFEDISTWFGLRVIFHGALTVMFVLTEFWINTLAPRAKRGLVMGIYATILSIGFAAGPKILGLVGSQGFLPFGIGMTILFLAGVPILFALGQSPDLEDEASRGTLGFILAVPVATFGVLAFGAIESGGMAFLPLYGLRLGMPEAQATSLVSMMAMGNVVLQIPLGLLADRVNRVALLALCATVGLAGALLMPLVSGSVLMLSIVLFVWGGFVAGLYTVGIVHLGNRFSGTDLAAANAAFVMMYACGMTIGLPGLGAAMDVWNPHGLTGSIALFCAAYLVLVAFTARRGRG